MRWTFTHAHMGKKRVLGDWVGGIVCAGCVKCVECCLSAGCVVAVAVGGAWCVVGGEWRVLRGVCIAFCVVCYC